MQKIRHLRSDIKDKLPTNNGKIDGESLIEHGEIVVNYNANNEFLSILNSENEIIKFERINHIL